MPTYDAVLFDSDGILVEPPATDTQVAATREAFAAVGVDDPAPAFVDDVVAGPTVERLRDVCAACGIDVERFWAAREEHDEQSQFRAFDAGERTRYDDVDAIAELPVARGVVSNNHHSTIAFVLDRFDLASTFDTYYGREKTVESLRKKKPAPHYLERALADLDAESALFVGDSDGDVIAARRAGIDSVFVRRSHCRDVELSVAPTYEVEGLDELGALVDG